MCDENIKYDLKEFQGKLLEMFKWFHDFCEENQLTYYMIGGTMLGALRHNGFIPWDDDIDVGMPRKDYIKLQQLMENHKGRYVFESFENGNQDFFYLFGKLYDTNTTLQENTREKITRGIYLDIFPLDGMGNNYEEAEKHFLAIDAKRKLFLARTTGIRKGRKWYKNLSVILFRMIPSFMVNERKIMYKLDRLARKKDYEKYYWTASSYGAWGKKEIMERAVFGRPTLYKFENFSAYGVEKADQYLTCLYGDWRKLPPQEKRVSHHDFLMFDLNKSYLE